ncbi:MAG: hypothetical protein ACI8QD_001009, partial [Cyclobacteriaceae bacterium]
SSSRSQEIEARRMIHVRSCLFFITVHKMVLYAYRLHAGQNILADL